MPRPRKPTATLAATGAFVAHPSRVRADTDEPSGAIGSWAMGPTEPAAVWDELVGIAPAGVLRSADRLALELAVRLVVQMRTDSGSLTAAGVTALVNVLGKLGLTPAGRVALSVPVAEPVPNPFAKYAPTKPPAKPRETKDKARGLLAAYRQP
jgi:hypothetical protein